MSPFTNGCLEYFVFGPCSNVLVSICINHMVSLLFSQSVLLIFVQLRFQNNSPVLAPKTMRLWNYESSFKGIKICHFKSVVASKNLGLSVSKEVCHNTKTKDLLTCSDPFGTTCLKLQRLPAVLTNQSCICLRHPKKSKQTSLKDPSK